MALVKIFSNFNLPNSLLLTKWSGNCLSTYTDSVSV